MPRLKNPFVCPLCNEHGGTIGSGPVVTSIQLPKLDRLVKMVEESPDHSWFIATMKLSDSFDFAAKRLLALERDAVLYPPISKKEDDDFALAIYESVNAFDPHTDTERKLFETRWLKERFDKYSIESRIIKAEKNTAENDLKRFHEAILEHQKSGNELDDVPTMRIRTPGSDKKHISKMSISYRYAAILFTALSRLAARGVRVIPPSESETEYAFAVYFIFDYYKYYIDLRFRRSLSQWAEILDTRIRHGYSAASSHSAGPVFLCKRCHYQKKHEITDIDTDVRARVKRDGSIELYCLKCGGTETIERKIKITTKNIKKMEGKVAAEIDRLAESVPIYKDLEKWFSNELKQNGHLTKELRIEFQRQEYLSHKPSFHMPPAYFIQHHDPSTKGRKRRCWLTEEDLLNISITDPVYKQNIDLLVDPSRSDTEESEQLRIMGDCIYILIKLGFPEEYLEDKPVTDMFHARYRSPG